MPKYESEYKTPKLLAYLEENIFHYSALCMNRNNWDKLKNGLGRVFFIDISLTPIGNEKLLPFVICCQAEKKTIYYELKVYRYDPKDDEEINVDTYRLYEDFRNYPGFNDIVTYATTSDDTNLKNWDKDTVTWELLVPQDDHHLSIEKLPDQIRDLALTYLNNHKDI